VQSARSGGAFSGRRARSRPRRDEFAVFASQIPAVSTVGEVYSANYCWFTVHRPVPRPLPQTRRHPHRDPADDRHVRLGPAARRPPTTASTDPCGSIRTHQTFLGQLGRTRAAERDRLTGDYHRALPIIGEIDAANTAHDTEADP
jgi:hypothetical protein